MSKFNKVVDLQVCYQSVSLHALSYNALQQLTTLVNYTMEPPVYSPQGHNHYEAIEAETPTLPYGTDYKLKMVTLNGEEIAAFNVDGEDLLCFPQVYEYFLKDLVSGMHTVYTKLKRMNIQGRNCNVEQVRMMRSVGAIGQVVNRCKLISREDFNRLYEDCLLYR